MKRFKNILLLADKQSGIKQLIKRASELAEKNNARLTIIDVQDDYAKEIGDIVSAKYLAEIQAASTKSKLERLTDLWESSRDNSVKGKVKILTGIPFLEVIREVIREEHDLLMKVAEEQSGLRSMLFGTTDMHLMRKCPCPLWIRKPTRKRKYQRVMAAVDPSPESSEREDLNIKIMDLATSLASEDKSELHVIHAWNFYGKSTLQGWRMNLPEDKADMLLKKTENKHRESVSELLSKYDLTRIKHKIHMPKGKASDLIPKTALNSKIDLIVMGTLARSGAAGVFIGNTAEQVLTQVNCSVLSVKPEGFKTPITID